MKTARPAVGVRATVHFVYFFGLTFLVLPALLSVVLGDGGWLRADRSWRSTLGLQLAAVLGLSAVQEFVLRGRGTQCPYDPPRRLVVSGPYAYVANPMQVCKVLSLLLWGLFLGNGWVALSGGAYLLVTVLFTAPREDRRLADRFGEPFRGYRRAVRRWWPRWRPHRDAEGRLYVAEGCGPCRGVGSWFRERGPVGLEIRAAESHPSRALLRVTYESDDLSAEGLIALARALEHLNLGWAFLGWMLRLPGVAALGQLVVDAVGGEPKPVADARYLSPSIAYRSESCRP
jgi:protein-S-isoprenylcysteine O-methyltransferase Ste14